jgi:hypothetical protein
MPHFRTAPLDSVYLFGHEKMIVSEGDSHEYSETAWAAAEW